MNWNLRVVVFLLALVLSVAWLGGGVTLAQRPVVGEAFGEPELVRGDPWQAPAGAGTLAVEAGPCDHLPAWVDNRGEGDVLPPGFPENGDVAEILDWTGLEVDRTHGCERARAGEMYLSLEALEIKCGAAVVQPRVDREGQPLSSALLWLNWPSMGEANQMTPEVDPRYFGEGVGCFTDGGGSCGWGYGGGSFITPGIGGPFSVWGNSCLDAWCVYGAWVGSDALKYTGWFGGTNHCTINPWFEPRVKEGGGGLPVPVDDAWLGVFEDGLLLYHVPLVHGMPPGNTDEYRGLGYIAPDGAWLWHVPGVDGMPQ